MRTPPITLLLIVLAHGGLVQLEYRNTHLSYVLTWFGMAFLLVVSIIIILRHKDDDGS